jgi:hypothetical protein
LVVLADLGYNSFLTIPHPKGGGLLFGQAANDAGGLNFRFFSSLHNFCCDYLVILPT